MLKEDDGELPLAVSYPTHKQSKISFELRYKGTGVVSQDSSMQVLQLSPTIRL